MDKKWRKKIEDIFQFLLSEINTPLYKKCPKYIINVIDHNKQIKEKNKNKIFYSLKM